MVESSDQIRLLCERALRAGLAPSAAAQWGRRAFAANPVVVGSARLQPNRVEADHRTIFDLASLTKPLAITTLSVVAVRQGAIGLDTPVGDILVELGDTTAGDIRIHNLLNHTGGLPAWLPLYCVANGDPERLFSALRSIQVAPPGAQVVYSCLGFVLLGKILERVSDQSLDVLFRREVASPLGIAEEIGYRPDPGDPRLAGGALRSVVEHRMVLEMGCDPALIPPPGPGLPDDGNARFLGGVSGNAGLFGSIGGVFALAREWIGPNRKVLSSSEVEGWTAPRTVGLEQERSLGWQLAGSPGCSAGPALGKRAYGHTGFTGVSLWIDPDQESVFTLLTNRNHPSQRETELHPLRRRFHALAGSSNR